MSELIYDFKVAGQKLYPAAYYEAASDIRNYLYSRFEFSGWDGIVNKTAVFTGSDNTAYNMLLENDMCHVSLRSSNIPASRFPYIAAI